MKPAEIRELLSEAGAALKSELRAYQLAPELFDRFPGDRHVHGTTVWKTGQLGKALEWTVFLDTAATEETAEEARSDLTGPERSEGPHVARSTQPLEAHS